MQRIGIDLPVAVGVDVGAHVLGEAVGAEEALLPREVTHRPVHPGEDRQQPVADVDDLAGAGVAAAALHVVGVVAGVVQIGDDLGARVRIGVLRELATVGVAIASSASAGTQPRVVRRSGVVIDCPLMHPCIAQRPLAYGRAPGNTSIHKLLRCNRYAASQQNGGAP